MDGGATMWLALGCTVALTLLVRAFGLVSTLLSWFGSSHVPVRPDQPPPRASSTREAVSTSTRAAEPVAAPSARPVQPELSLVRQKTPSSELIDELAASLVLVQHAAGLELDDGRQVLCDAITRQYKLANRHVIALGETLLQQCHSAVEQLAEVGYSETDVRRLLCARSSELGWLEHGSLRLARVEGSAANSTAQAKRRVTKWCAIQARKVGARMHIGRRCGACPPDRKRVQREVLERMRATLSALQAAVEHGIAEAEDDLCAICFERPRTIVLLHADRPTEDRHQVCELCHAHLLASATRRCPFCNERLANDGGIQRVTGGAFALDGPAGPPGAGTATPAAT